MTFLKKNNKGFTLVELIIAVAILGLVVGPLLSNFVTSARISARSTEIGDATLAAENVLEAFETEEWGTSLEIGGKTPSEDNIITKLEIGDIILPDYREYKYKGAEIGYNTFDIDVVLDPGFYAEVDDRQTTAYGGADGTDKWTADEIKAVEDKLGEIMGDANYGELNNKKIAYATPMDYLFQEVGAINPTQDAINDLLFEAEATTAGVSKITDPVLNDAISGSRRIDINVIEVSSENESKTVKVEIVYTFELKHRELEVPETTTIEFISDTISLTGEAGAVVKDGEKLSLYLMTTPWYYGTLKEDNVININNEANVGLEFVIVNQTPTIPDLTSEAFKEAKITSENAYLQACDDKFKGALIRVYSEQKRVSDVDTEVAAPVTILSNIDKKMGTYAGTSDATFGSALVQVQEFYEGVVHEYVELGELSDSNVTGSKENLVNQEAEPRIYNVKITIKEPDPSGEVLHTLTGTILK